MNPEEWIPLAEVQRPHGVRGELRVRMFNEESDLLLDQEEVLVRFPSGDSHEVSIDSARRANDVILMKLYSVDDRDRADELRGATLCVKRKAFPPLEEGEFYACDVVGAKVALESDPTDIIGVITKFQNYPSVDIFGVKIGPREIEVPITEGFVVSVDTEKGLVLLVTLDGLDE